MLVKIGATLMVLLAMASVGFGAYELMNKEVTNGLLAFILGVVTINLAVNWMELYGD